MSDLRLSCQWHVDRAEKLRSMAPKYLGKGFFDPDLAAACKRLADQHGEVALLKDIWLKYKDPTTRLACMRALQKKSLAEAEFWRLRGFIWKACDATESAAAWGRQVARETALLCR